MTFDLPSNSTVNKKGEKTILVKTTGHEKTHFTVALACMADGTKLKPLIIFKRKKLQKTAKFPRGVVVRAQVKGWMDEEGVKAWMRAVWDARPGALLHKKLLLVWDMFRAHLTDGTKDAAKEMRTDLCVIPGGLTSLLQPLDVCLNKPFKDRVRKLWNDWMASDEPKPTTKGGNIMKPDITLVAEWVKAAWDSMPPEMIRKSFLKCGISNAMDGSEDDAVYSGLVAKDKDDSDNESETESDAANDDSSDDGNDVYDDGEAEYTAADVEELFGNDENDSDFDVFD